MNNDNLSIWIANKMIHQDDKIMLRVVFCRTLKCRDNMMYRCTRKNVYVDNNHKCEKYKKRVN